jgi:hypothetical protein
VLGGGPASRPQLPPGNETTTQPDRRVVEVERSGNVPAFMARIPRSLVRNMVILNMSVDSLPGNEELVPGKQGITTRTGQAGAGRSVWLLVLHGR